MQVSILLELLQFDPSRRPTSAKLLQNSFFSDYHDIDDEPICHSPFDFKFESSTSKEDIKSQIVKAIDDYHNRKMK